MSNFDYIISLLHQSSPSLGEIIRMGRLPSHVLSSFMCDCAEHIFGDVDGQNSSEDYGDRGTLRIYPICIDASYFWSPKLRSCVLTVVKKCREWIEGKVSDVSLVEFMGKAVALSDKEYGPTARNNKYCYLVKHLCSVDKHQIVLNGMAIECAYHLLDWREENASSRDRTRIRQAEWRWQRRRLAQIIEALNWHRLELLSFLVGTTKPKIKAQIAWREESEEALFF